MSLKVTQVSQVSSDVCSGSLGVWVQDSQVPVWDLKEMKISCPSPLSSAAHLGAVVTLPPSRWSWRISLIRGTKVILPGLKTFSMLISGSHSVTQDPCSQWGMQLPRHFSKAREAFPQQTTTGRLPRFHNPAPLARGSSFNKPKSPTCTVWFPAFSYLPKENAKIYMSTPPTITLPTCVCKNGTVCVNMGRGELN